MVFSGCISLFGYEASCHPVGAIGSAFGPDAAPYGNAFLERKSRADFKAERFWSSGDFTTKSAKNTKVWKISWLWF